MIRRSWEREGVPEAEKRVEHLAWGEWRVGSRREGKLGSASKYLPWPFWQHESRKKQENTIPIRGSGSRHTHPSHTLYSYIVRRRHTHPRFLVQHRQHYLLLRFFTVSPTVRPKSQPKVRIPRGFTPVAGRRAIRKVVIPCFSQSL